MTEAEDGQELSVGGAETAGRDKKVKYVGFREGITNLRVSGISGEDFLNLQQHLAHQLIVEGGDDVGIAVQVLYQLVTFVAQHFSCSFTFGGKFDS